MLLPGVRSRSSDEGMGSSVELSDGKLDARTPRALKRQTCDELLGIIESNGMAAIAAGASDERTGPGWEASCILGKPEDPDEFTMWLGDVDDAMNFEALKERKVFAIVNMALQDCRIEQSFRESLNKNCPEDVAPEDRRWDGMKFNEEAYRKHLGCDDMWYLGLDAEDAVGYPINEHFDQLVAFIRRCREARRPVLVHCMQGLNRAGCASAVFLMREGLAASADGLGLRETVDYLSRRRIGVLQNTGFLGQLALHGRPGSNDAEGFMEDLVMRQQSNDKVDEENRKQVLAV